MIPRQQLPVSPSISAAALVRAARELFAPGAQALGMTASDLRREFGACECLLTDSGTSALVLALRVTTRRRSGAAVALPGYGCADFASAVSFTGTRVRLYDLDPITLSPDLDSLRRTLRRGVDVVVVAHYYGYAADICGVREIAASHGVPVVEDAAQAAGGSLHGMRLGGLGDLSILSFGRGKSLVGGRGGALLGFSSEWRQHIAELPPLSSRLNDGSVRDLSATAAQWAFGRPWLYAVPSSIRWFHLGEMVDRPAHEPRGPSRAAASLVRSSLSREPRERATRRRNATILRVVAQREGSQVLPIRPIPHAEPGFLRFAVLDRSGLRTAASRLGVVRGYPRTLHEEPRLLAHLVTGEPPTPGATELRTSLFTLPTHSMVTERDLFALREWIRHPAANGAPGLPPSVGARQPQWAVEPTQRMRAE